MRFVHFSTFFSFFAIFNDVGLSGREISVSRLQTVSGVTDFVDLQGSESRRNRLSISLRVGVRINHKNFVFALLKTVQKQAERNSGRILRLFNCNERGFMLLREAPKPKFLPGLVSPIKV